MEPIGKWATAYRRGRSALALRYSLVALVAVAGLVGVMSSNAGAHTRKATATQAAAKPTLRIGLPYSGFEYYANIAEVPNSGQSGALEVSLGYSSLFHMEPNGTVVGELASSGSYFNPGTGAQNGFKFTLVHGVRFSDGTPLTAATMVDYLDFYAKQIGGYQGLFGKDPKFTAVGKWEVRMVLPVPVADMETVLSDVGDFWGTPASPACVANPKLFTNATCGTGPYKLDTAASVPNSSYVFVPNPYYYDKAAVKYSRVVEDIIPAPSSELAALQAGQLNLAYIASDSSTVAAAKAAGLKVYSAPVGAYQLLLNEKDPSTSALSNSLVRQAISYALDRPALAQLVAPGGYAKATDLFPVTDVSDPAYASHFTYNPAKARSLLAQAGYSSGLTLNLALIEARTQDQTMFNGVAQELKAVGITLNPVNYTSPGSIFNNAGYLLTTIGNTSQVQYSSWLSAGNPVTTWPVDSYMVSLFNKAIRAPNPVSDWTQMLQYESEQSYFVTICSVSGIWYVSKSVQGVDVTAPRIGAVLISELSPS